MNREEWVESSERDLQLSQTNLWSSTGTSSPPSLTLASLEAAMRTLLQSEPCDRVLRVVIKPKKWFLKGMNSLRMNDTLFMTVYSYRAMSRIMDGIRPSAPLRKKRQRRQ